MLGTGPLLLIAYLGWLLFWRPSVVVHDAGVRLENPFRSVMVPWAALVHVDTRYALTLVTPSRSYGAWAAPAPGIWGGRNARPEDLRGLPGTTYGPGNSVRPGDLKSTDSGQAAQLVRTRWQQLVESGAIDAGNAAATPVTINVRWLDVGGTVLLLAFSIWGVALL
jgi:hypothetical protein